MRPLHPLLLLIAIYSAAGASSSPGEAPPCAVYSLAETVQPESLLVRGRLELPPLRDLAQDRFGEILALTRDGQFLALGKSDSLRQRSFGGDLGSGAWPEALAADGMEWLLLLGQGQEVVRLGRRGEALERLRIPEQETFWRGLAADVSGRIWLADESGGRLARLSRGGQILQLWDLEARLPGFRGPLRDWCPDGSGGLYLAEGWPLACHHLNAAGNLLRSWQPELPAGDLALASAPGGQLFLALGPEGSEPRLLADPRGGRLYLASAGALWTLELPPRESP